MQQTVYSVWKRNNFSPDEQNSKIVFLLSIVHFSINRPIGLFLVVSIVAFDNLSRNSFFVALN